MRIALRGEGSTDIGYVDAIGHFVEGPMTILIKKLSCYQMAQEECCGGVETCMEWMYIPKEKISMQKQHRKKMVLRSTKNSKMKTKGFFKNAEAFASIAKEKDADIAIFFVDTDKDDYEQRYQSVKDGLKVGGYDETGVPMIPKKISEVWLLCCYQMQNCRKLEELPTGDESNMNHPKRKIKDLRQSHESLAEDCEADKIDMPSFNRFRNDFKKAINSYCYGLC